MNKLHNAINGSCFNSEFFNMHSLKWYLNIAPNGRTFNEENSFILSLVITSIPPNINNICLSIMMKINECKDKIYKKVNHTRNGLEITWYAGTPTLNQIKQLKTLSIQIEIGILDIYYYNKMEMITPKQNNISNQTNNFENLMMNFIQMQKTMNDKFLKATQQRNEENINDEKLNVEENDTSELKKWLNDIVKLGQYMNIFIKNGFYDLSDVKLIDMDTLNEMGINTIAHKLRILHQIDVLKQQCKT
eukprot:538395_1